MKSYDIIIVGAGPAGMSAAISASEDKNVRILLLEGADRVGKKILVTGNGRCNLTNVRQDLSCYRSDMPEKVKEVLDRFGPEETAAFFRQLGILTRNIRGYIYPYNEQASSVRDAFEIYLKACDNIRIRTGCRV
ncbi:MAG: NAD(P)/FAD-dependent oxidoreductase, partial [Eubacterium sp.]|nr:NAD(P)/FAD-dependent oxidoreductase [Eubacterium sp.]